jgi:hypothetical protein
MKDGIDQFNPYNYSYDVAEWMIREFGRNLARINSKFKSKYKNLDEFKHEDSDVISGYYDKLPKELQERCASWVHKEVLDNDPANSSTYLHMDLQGERLKSNTWLIHFSDHAYDIWKEGFTKGVDDLTRLGLTNYLSDFEKSYPGYNFAFEALSRDALRASHYHMSRPKYGKNAVMFQSSGVPCYHYGDEEKQIIFYGKHINPKNIVFLRNGGGTWEVIARTGNREDNAIYKNDRFENTVKWVIANYQQYKSVL